jgi:hypothetical protein
MGGLKKNSPYVCMPLLVRYSLLNIPINIGTGKFFKNPIPTWSWKEGPRLIMG